MFEEILGVENRRYGEMRKSTLKEEYDKAVCEKKQLR